MLAACDIESTKFPDDCIWYVELIGPTIECIARITTTSHGVSILFANEMAQEIVLHDQCHVVWMEGQKWINPNIFDTNWTVVDLLGRMPTWDTGQTKHCCYIETVTGLALRVKGKRTQRDERNICFRVLWCVTILFIIMIIARRCGTADPLTPSYYEGVKIIGSRRSKTIIPSVTKRGFNHRDISLSINTGGIK